MSKYCLPIYSATFEEIPYSTHSYTSVGTKTNTTKNAYLQTLNHVEYPVDFGNADDDWQSLQSCPSYEQHKPTKIDHMTVITQLICKGFSFINITPQILCHDGIMVCVMDVTQPLIKFKTVFNIDKEALSRINKGTIMARAGKSLEIIVVVQEEPFILMGDKKLEKELENVKGDG